MSIQSVTPLPPGVDKVTILGYGISARSTIDFFLANYPETKLRVSELKPQDQFDDVSSYQARGVEFQFGVQTEDFVLADNRTVSKRSFDVQVAQKEIATMQNACVAPLENPASKSESQTSFVMISPGIPPHAPIIKAIQDSGIAYGTDLDLFLEYAPGLKLAITGTNGKTTTASLLAHIFDTEAIGNIGLPFLEFAKLKNQEVFVLELSSAQLFYSQLKKQVDCSIYLNFTDDHLDWHKDLAEYKAAKAKLFEHDGVFVLNQDDATTLSLQNDLSLIFSTQGQADAYYKEGALYFMGKHLIDVDELALVGEHNYSNTLAAVLAAEQFGKNLSQIKEKLKSFKAVPHRLEYVTTINGHKAYNDSKATNPDSAIQALNSFDKSIAIVGGKNKNLDMSEFISVLKNKAELVIAIGELQNAICQELEGCLRASSLEQAVEIAVAHNSDLPIVLAPASSSFDMFKSYQDRGDKFKKLLYTMASGSRSPETQTQ